VPHGVDIKKIRAAIKSHSGVDKISKLYVWGIDSEDYVICCSLSSGGSESYEIIESTRRELKQILSNMGFKLVIIEIT
jgi:Co/Zn/Cd efflux system component